MEKRTTGKDLLQWLLKMQNDELELEILVPAHYANCDYTHLEDLRVETIISEESEEEKPVLLLLGWDTA